MSMLYGFLTGLLIGFAMCAVYVILGVHGLWIGFMGLCCGLLTYIVCRLIYDRKIKNESDDQRKTVVWVKK